MKIITTTIILTGVTGLLGSWLAEKLLNNNCEIKGVALNGELDFLLKSKKIYNDIEINYFDIANEEKIKLLNQSENNISK